MSKRKADDEIFHEYEWIPRDYRRTFVFIGMHGYRMIVVAEGRPRAGMRMRATACHDGESQRRGLDWIEEVMEKVREELGRNG